MTERILALDFGGTKNTAALHVLGEAGWRAKQRVFSPPGAEARSDIETMMGLGHALLGEHRAQAIGVSFGGPVDFNTGRVHLSHHVPGWEATPLQELLASEFGAPCSVDNDANAAALGEYRLGAGRGCRHLLYITVSTGVGGGWILDGKPWRGCQQLAGEIGHMVIDPQGPECLCGKRGCVERLASGPYLALDAAEALRAQPDRGAGLQQLVDRQEGDLTAKLVARAARGGDRLAGELIDRSAGAIGVAIGNAANLINPELFLLGGGVTQSGDRFWEIVRRNARKTALPEIDFEILPAALGDEAPLWGAVVLAEELLRI